MTENTWDDLQRELVERLPRLLHKALSTYTYFASTTPPEGAKDFTAFQASCRAALAHIHLLIKLAQWARSAGQPASMQNADDSISRLIEEAEEALDRYSRADF